jgi:hypothetical protein
MTRKLIAALVALNQLGMGRETSEKQLLYLTDLATRFQRLVSSSVGAKYGNDGIFDDMKQGPSGHSQAEGSRHRPAVDERFQQNK